MVGTIEPRKGHKIIYDLFTQLWETHNIDLSLTFIGKKGWMIDELTDSFSTSEYLNKNFFWFNQASDEFLKLCYASTDAVIIASLDEGFGLPIIEAAQHGCRIIANDIPVFREVAPPECFFLRLDNFDAATLQFRDWLKKPSPRCSSVKLQTWGESTKQIVTKLKLISSLQTK